MRVQIVCHKKNRRADVKIRGSSTRGRCALKYNRQPVHQRCVCFCEYLNGCSVLNMSKKASMNDWTYDPVPWKGPILTKHARKRCTQRHINPLHIGVDSSITVRFGTRGKVVATVYKNPPTEFVRACGGHRRTRRDYRGHVVDGVEHIRRTHRPQRIPKDVAKHLEKLSHTDHRTSFEPTRHKNTNVKLSKSARKKMKKRRKEMEKQMARRRATKGLRNRL